VGLSRAHLFAKTDRGHFQQAGSDADFVLRMSFDAAEDDDAISDCREFFEVRSRAGFGTAEFQCVHRSTNGRADGFLADAQSAQKLGLAATVLPPWLPIAGMINGLPPAERMASAMPETNSMKPPMPRLPAVMATCAPGNSTLAE
jgi:hypothetical protein